VEHYNWELFDRLPHNSDPSNHPLITYLKNWLQSHPFNNNKELMQGENVAELRGDRIL
jgi:hypothetical protein